jgi:predicted DNA-binding protein
MKQNTTESFRVESEILKCIKLITSKTGQTTKGYISIVLKKQIEKDMKKHFKIIELECQEK